MNTTSVTGHGRFLIQPFMAGLWYRSQPLHIIGHTHILACLYTSCSHNRSPQHPVMTGNTYYMVTGHGRFLIQPVMAGLWYRSLPLHIMRYIPILAYLYTSCSHNRSSRHPVMTGNHYYTITGHGRFLIHPVMAGLWYRSQPLHTSYSIRGSSRHLDFWTPQDAMIAEKICACVTKQDAFRTGLRPKKKIYLN
jgi:hypothetical protein